jgi:uncharacterized protein YkwD
MLPRMRAFPGERRRPLARNRPLTIFTLVAALVAVWSVSGAWATRAGNRAHHVAVVQSLEPSLLDAINDLRRSEGLRPLRLNPKLAAAARQQSISMAEHGVFQHASLDGTPFSKRIEALYARNGKRIWSVGENLAWAAPGMSARKALRLWLASPPHRENLLSPAWREIGLGAVHAFAGGFYGGRAVTILTADFGVRR